MTKVALVGAGSVEFSRRLVADLLSFPELHGLEIALHDIDAGRLETAVAISRVTAEQLGAAPRITGELERRAALEGADAVFNMVQIGGHAATVRDIEIPERFGLRQSVGDTIGVGGIFRALRTAPHMLALGRDLAEVAPDGWLLNYTNPMAMLCALVYRGTPTTRVVGLCHSVQGTVAHLARLVGAEPGEVTYLAAGVNHQAFVLRLEHDGKDLYPRLRERLDEPEERRRVRVELFRRFGYFPTESSEHGAEYLPWLMRRDGELERFRIPVGEIVRRSEENLGAYEEARAALARGEVPAAERSEEYAALIVHSLVTGEPRVINGNVANHGLVPGLPEGTCVEVPCLVDGTGVRPVAVPEYPAELAALNRTYVNVVELVVEAVLQERPELVPLAVLLDPNAGASLSLDEATELCAELTRAHGDLLPEPLRAR